MAEFPPDNSPLVIAGIDLRAIASALGPFASLYLTAGSDRKQAGTKLLEEAGVGASEVSRILDSLSDQSDISQALIASPDFPVRRFELLSPLHFDIARHDGSPSLGPIIEEFQRTTSHAVVTVEDGRFGLTTFSSQQVPDAEPTSGSISSSIETVVESLRFSTPRFIALAGSEKDLEGVSNALKTRFPFSWIQHYSTDQLDADLDDLSDQIVRDADTRAAEATTHALGAYRVARDAGRTIEGAAALQPLEQGLAEDLLIHDDPFDERVVGTDRLVDRCLKAAIIHRTRVTLIPMVPVEQGPAQSIGVVLGSDGASVIAGAAEPQLATTTTAQSNPDSAPDDKPQVKTNPLA